MLYCKSIGKKEFPHLVCLHGFLGSHSDFLLMAGHLKEDFYIHLIDLPGHGKSELTENPLKQIQDAISHYTHSEPYFLVGYSMGGRIALKIAQQDPNCQSLALLAANPGLQTEEEKKEREEIDKHWSDILLKEGISAFLEKWYSQSLFFSLKRKKRLFEAMINRREHNDPLKLAKMLMHFSLSKDDFCKQYSKPTLALYGVYDKAYTVLYTKLPEAVKVVSISDSGHALPIENPSACAHIIKAFFKEHVCLNQSG